MDWGLNGDFKTLDVSLGREGNDFLADLHCAADFVLEDF